MPHNNPGNTRDYTPSSKAPCQSLLHIRRRLPCRGSRQRPLIVNPENLRSERGDREITAELG